jgi:hypothetical protein
MLSLIFRYISNNSPNWDILDLTALPPHHFDLYKQALAAAPLPFHEYFCYGNWYQDGIDFSGDDYIKKRGSSVKRNVIRNRRKLEAVGALEFRMITEPEAIREYMRMYFQTYSRSWKQREAVGSGFISNFMRLSAEKGWLRLGFHFLDGNAIATGFAIVHRGIVYFPKSAYDPEYRRFGIGAIWLAEMMKYFIDIDKVHTIDWLMGDESYKAKWLSKRRERKGLIAFNSTFKGTCFRFFMRTVLPIMRKNVYLNKIKNIGLSKWQQTNLIH